ncbi:unnamed protein product [Trichobilharzia regenti]|nr:unnamed protein product [Trichobilharzia regenti]
MVQNKEVVIDEAVEVKTGEQEAEGEEQGGRDEEEEQHHQEQEQQEQEQIVKPDTHQESSAPIVTRTTTTMTLKQFLAQKIGGTDAQPPKDLILSCWIRLSVINGEAEFDTPSGLLLRQPFARQAPIAQSSRTNRFIYDSRWETDTNLAKQLTATRTFTPDIMPSKF